MSRHLKHSTKVNESIEVAEKGLHFDRMFQFYALSFVESRLFAFVLVLFLNYLQCGVNGEGGMKSENLVLLTLKYENGDAAQETRKIVASSSKKNS